MKYENIPTIKFVFPDTNGLFIVWDNFDIRYISKEDFNIDIHTKEVIKNEIWSKIKFDNRTVSWTNYKIAGQPYGVGYDSLFDISKPVELNNKIFFILRKSKNLTQAELAKKIKVKQPEISALETGKKTNLKLLQKALSVLL